MTSNKPDPIAVAKAELADAKAQRDLAQQNFTAAQAQIQQGQQKAAEAQQMALIAARAVQRCEAFLKKLEPEETALAETDNETPLPAPCEHGEYGPHRSRFHRRISHTRSFLFHRGWFHDEEFSPPAPSAPQADAGELSAYRDDGCLAFAPNPRDRTYVRL